MRVRDIGEAGGAEQIGPFFGGVEMGGRGKIFGPLMAVGIVAVIVDEDGGAATFGENAKDFLQAAHRIGPIVGGFDGNPVGEKIRVPGDFVSGGDYEEDIFDFGEILAGAPNHFVGNVEADDAAIWNALGEEADEPAGAAANVEDIVVGADLHAVEDGEGDGEMAFFHLLTAAGGGPAVEFFAEEVVGHFCAGYTFIRVQALLKTKGAHAGVPGPLGPL
jgi:hypothetical protein